MMNKEIKESTQIIYNCLGETFWTFRHCQNCCISFTPADYRQGNYQLHFTKVLKPNLDSIKNGNCLTVMVQLTHQQCCSGCVSYRQRIWPKKEKSTN